LLSPDADGVEAAVALEPGIGGRVMPIELASEADGDAPGSDGRVMPMEDVGAGVALAPPPNQPPKPELLEAELDAEPPDEGSDGRVMPMEDVGAACEDDL
jgi:hypothetical protein